MGKYTSYIGCHFFMQYILLFNQPHTIPADVSSSDGLTIYLQVMPLKE